MLAFDKYKTGFANGYVREAALNKSSGMQMLSVFTCRLPMRHFTTPMTLFDAFKEQPYFLTACRGKVTNTEALIKALRNGKIAAAGIDVLENEKKWKLIAIQKGQILIGFALNPTLSLHPTLLVIATKPIIKWRRSFFRQIGLVAIA